MKKQLSTGGFRFVLSLFVVCLAVGVFIKYSQTASSQRNEFSSPPIEAEDNAPVSTNGTVTTYRNGVSSIEPTGFAITGPVRDLPLFDDKVTKKQQREEQMVKRLREKGYTEKQIEAEEINRENGHDDVRCQHHD